MANKGDLSGVGSITMATDRLHTPDQETLSPDARKWAMPFRDVTGRLARNVTEDDVAQNLFLNTGNTDTLVSQDYDRLMNRSFGEGDIANVTNFKQVIIGVNDMDLREAPRQVREDKITIEVEDGQIEKIEVESELEVEEAEDGPEDEDADGLSSVFKVGETADKDVPKSDEHVANALNRDENAARFLADETERALVDYAQSCFDLSYTHISDRYDHWKDAEVAHDVYVTAETAEQSANGSTSSAGSTRRRKKPRIIDTIKTPYSRAINDTICTYNLAIFGGSPAFKIEPTGRARKSLSMSRGAKIIESELHTNMRRIGYEAIIHQMTLDGNRYGMAPIATFWGEDGNAPINLDPWSYFPDPRVTSQFRHEAEFSGYRTWAGLAALYRRNLYQNLYKLEEDTSDSVQLSWQCNTSLREVVRGQSIDPRTPSASTNRTQQHADTKWGLGNAHVLNTIYAFLSPKRFGIDAPFGLYRLVVADEKYVILFDKSPYPHGDIPVIHAEHGYDAHKTFASGGYDLVMPLQRFQDWLLRTRVENVQAVVQNRLVVDPGRINIRDILDPNAARLIRTLPGQNPKEAMMPVEVNDVTRGYWGDLDATGQLMQRALAANDTAQGVMSDTQRTATEISRLTALGQQRLGTQARLTSARTMRPWVRQMVSNQQAFSTGGGLTRLSPSIEGVEQDGWFEWDQRDILGDFDYVVVDGTLPANPMDHSDSIMKALRVLSETGLAQSWDVDRFVEKLIQSFGFVDVEDWKKQGAPSLAAPENQVVEDEQIARDLEAGNVVPMSQVTGQAGGGPSAEDVGAALAAEMGGSAAQLPAAPAVTAPGMG